MEQRDWLEYRGHWILRHAVLKADRVPLSEIFTGRVNRALITATSATEAYRKVDSAIDLFPAQSADDRHHDARSFDFQPDGLATRHSPA
jgi:hypothetical protein